MGVAVGVIVVVAIGVPVGFAGVYILTLGGARSSLGESILPVSAWPTTYHLPRGAPPDLHRDLGVEMLVDGRGAGDPTSSRNWFGERAKNGEDNGK